MPATTPKGYPYPLGTDRLTDGDDAIHSLATAVDTKLGAAASGAVNVPVAIGQASASVVVTFPAGRFSVAPVVVAGSSGTNPGWGTFLANTVSAAGCTLTTVNRDGTPASSAFTVLGVWFAHQTG